MRRSWYFLLLAIVLWAGHGTAGYQAYYEDFTSLEFCDVMRTRAWWDTQAGELKLHLYQPVWLWNYATPSDSCYGVTISGNYAYVGDYSCGLQVFDISDPEHPFFLANYDTPDYAHNIAISGDYAYVADWNGGLQVVDISDPANPCYAGSYITSCIYSVDIATFSDLSPWHRNRLPTGLFRNDANRSKRAHPPAIMVWGCFRSLAGASAAVVLPWRASS